ncbi:WAT1-related protein At3g28050-like isoform X2 [Gastrolobium bilobum]|uniref:WAT1-related protein At3g28050-like isoform X2 n=1 Tax=Gastrolobium bilobum TaxID=150636 RepID=UPI002AB2EC92|nr:WAT1-related protein At3g28050-like isoform X2 [Gastrolobium bilobum]
MGLRSFLVEWTPFAAMVIVEFLDVGLATLSKAAMSRGMSHFVFVVYSNALATLILLPSSFIINRKSTRPPLSFSLLCKFFLLGLVGITVMQNCVFTGISYSSPTLGSAMSNLTPAITFVLAVIFRMEKLDIGSSISQIKIMGTVLSISGALLVTLYKGTPIGSFRIEPSPSQPSPSMLAEISSWVIGGIFLAIASLSLAVWNIAQAAILKGYPSQLTIVAFYCLFGTIQCAILSVIVVRDSNAWNLKPDIELISILYSATFGSVVTFSVLTWCINRKGPVFVTMFKPVGIAIAAFMSVVFLGETLYVGSVIGALVIALGFYTVLWAQSREGNYKSLEVDTLSSPSAQASPLLESP